MAVRPTVTDADSFGKELMAASPDLLGSGTRQSRKFRSSYVADAGDSVSEAMHAASRRRI